VANADDVRNGVKAKLAAAMPSNWTVYDRPDPTLNPADKLPLVYVVPIPERILEEETDNQQVTGYGCGIVLAFPQGGKLSTDPNLASLRRTAQQAVYRTDYSGLTVESILLDEGVTFPLPGPESGVMATGFTITLGLVEARYS